MRSFLICCCEAHRLVTACQWSHRFGKASDLRGSRSRRLSMGGRTRYPWEECGGDRSLSGAAINLWRMSRSERPVVVSALLHCQRVHRHSKWGKYNGSPQNWCWRTLETRTRSSDRFARVSASSSEASSFGLVSDSGFLIEHCAMWFFLQTEGGGAIY